MAVLALQTQLLVHLSIMLAAVAEALSGMAHSIMAALAATEAAGLAQDVALAALLTSQLLAQLTQAGVAVARLVKPTAQLAVLA
jgi:hypothetical protein